MPEGEDMLINEVDYCEQSRRLKKYAAFVGYSKWHKAEDLFAKALYSNTMLKLKGAYRLGTLEDIIVILTKKNFLFDEDTRESMLLKYLDEYLEEAKRVR